MYTFDSRIRYSEVDKNGRLRLESLIDYFQDCSTFQTQDGPATMEYLKETGMAWVLSSWQIEVLRYPELCEEVTIGTIPYELKGYFGFRNFFMDTKKGERLAVANTLWTLFDFKKGVPGRVTDLIKQAYPVEERIEMEYADRKIRVDKDADRLVAENITVRKNNLDTNDHVNNGQYIRMAIDSLPVEGFVTRSMRAEYKKQAKLGDILYPRIVKGEKDGKRLYTVELKNSDAEDVCVVELKEW